MKIPDARSDAARPDLVAEKRAQVDEDAGDEVGEHDVEGTLAGRQAARASVDPAEPADCGRAFAAVASTAIGSVSRPSASRAPSLTAAIARIPEPQPTSRTRAPSRAPRSASDSTPARQRRVVGWSPVPNAIPGIEGEDDVVRAIGGGAATSAGSRAGVRLGGPGSGPSRRPPSRLRGRAVWSARRSAAARTPGGDRAPPMPRPRVARRPRRSPAGRYARTMAGRLGSTRAPSPSSVSSNAGSTLVPAGALRPRISATASTASMSAATESSSHAPAPGAPSVPAGAFTPARASRAIRRRSGRPTRRSPRRTRRGARAGASTASPARRR